MKNIIKFLLLSIVSGVLISIGGTVLLSCDNKYVGALAFSCGLFFICEGGFKLYTGAIGYALDNDKKNNFLLIDILIGNFIGCLLTVLILKITRIFPTISEKAYTLVQNKLDYPWYSFLGLSIFCGLLIFLGVNNFKQSSNNFSKVIGIIFCVFVFILCGFEHCIADMYYFMIADVWSLKAVLLTLIAVIGNSIGGLFIPAILKTIKKLKT